MLDNFADVPQITPILVNLDQTTEILDLSLLGNSDAEVILPAWDFMRDGQLAKLFLNEKVVDQKTVQVDVTTTPPTYSIPSFHIPTRDKSTGELNYIIGENTLYCLVTDVPTGPSPNQNSTNKLQFKVVIDELSGSFTIDITEGAAGYSDLHPDLMPANIAVIRAKPNNLDWTAHGIGGVEFQDIGTTDTCNFTFDENGVCPLVLIRYDGEVKGSNLAASKDGIYITRKHETENLIQKEVIFGEYKILTGAESAEFNSISYNTVGIADGETPTIISIIMTDTNIDQNIQIQLDDGLTFHKKSINVSDAAVYKSNLFDQPVQNLVTEFYVTASVAASYNILICSKVNPDAIFKITIEFKNLS